MPQDSDHVQVVTVFPASVPEETQLTDGTMTNLILTETQPYLTNPADSIVDETENDSEKIDGHLEGNVLNSSHDVVVESEKSSDRLSSELAETQARGDTVV